MEDHSLILEFQGTATHTHTHPKEKKRNLFLGHVEEKEEETFKDKF